MFYVYDVDGLRFKGPLEALEEQRKVSRRVAVTAIKEEDRATFTPEESGGQALAAYRRMANRQNMIEPLVHIYQIMSSPVSSISPDISLTNAWSMLIDGEIRQLLVTTPARDLVGLLTDRDILRRINVVNDQVLVNQDLTVGEVITGETVTTDAMSDIRRVARVMAYYHIDAMPVIENEKPVGIVTRGDILRGFAENPKLNLWA